MRLIEKSTTESLYNILKESDHEQENKDWKVIKDCSEGEIVEKDGKQYYNPGNTFNGYCFKDADAYEKDRDAVCYITEGDMEELSDDDGLVSVEEVNKNLKQYIEEGGVSTHNSICEEVRTMLLEEEYFYEYSDGRRVEAKDIDDAFVEQVALDVFETVDWQTASGYLLENDWTEALEDYYNNKKEKSDSLKESEENVVKKLSDGDVEVRIVKAPNGKYFNYYYSADKEHWDSSAGSFETEEEALEMAKKHRPTVKEKKVYTVDDFDTLEDAIKELKRVKGVDYFTKEEWDNVEEYQADDYIKDIVDNELNENNKLDLKVGDEVEFYSTGYKENGKFSNKPNILMKTKVKEVLPNGAVSCKDPQGVKDFDYISQDEIISVNGKAVDKSINESVENKKITLDDIEELVHNTGAEVVVEDIVYKGKSDDLIALLDYELKNNGDMVWGEDVIEFIETSSKVDELRNEDLEESAKEEGKTKLYLCLDCNKEFEITDNKWPYGVGNCPYCSSGDTSLEESYEGDKVEKETYTDEEKEEYGLDDEGYDESGEKWIHCAWCGDLHPVSELRKELNLGWICKNCQDALYSRGEKAVYDDNAIYESVVENGKYVYYFVVGICLDENRPNASKEDFYDMPFGIPYKLMDENFGVSQVAIEAMRYVDNYVKNGVPGTFGVVVKEKEPYEGFFDEIDNSGWHDGIEFYDITHFEEKGGEIIFCEYSTKDDIVVVKNAGKDGIKESVEEDPDIEKFLNKYNSIYRDAPIMKGGTLWVDNIRLKGSGISKGIVAKLYPNNKLEIYNEEWGLTYDGMSINDVEEMSQYWFADDFENNEEFNEKITKAVKTLYKDMIAMRDKLNSEDLKEDVNVYAYGKMYYSFSEEEWKNMSDEERQGIIIDTADQATEEEGHTVETDEVEILTEGKKSSKKKDDKRVIMQQGNVTCFKESDNKFLVFENEKDNEKEYKDQESAMEDFMNRVGVDINSDIEEK